MDSSVGSPLIKVFQSSSQVGGGGSQLHDGDSESISSYQNRPEGGAGGTASRKVIKATITIPLPKADHGGLKYKTSKNRQLKNDDDSDNNSLEDQDSGSD